MNKEMIQRLKYKKVRIRPVPLKRKRSGEVQEEDSVWFVDDAAKEFLDISNSTIGYSKRIGTDHIVEYRTDSKFGSDGILILKSQISIEGNEVKVEPLLIKSSKLQ